MTYCRFGWTMIQEWPNILLYNLLVIITKKTTLATKKVLPLAIGTSRFGCQKMPDGSFVSDTTNIKHDQEILEFTIGEGLSVIDTAHVYGDSELVVGRAIRQFDRNRLVIATKVGFNYLKPADLEREIDISCRRLGTIPDIIFIHNRHEGHMGLDNDKILSTLEKKVNELNSVCLGISNYQPDELSHSLSILNQPVSVYQAKANISHPRPDLQNLFDICEDNGIAFMASSGLDRGGVVTVENKIVNSISQKYNLTTGQCGIITLILGGFIPIIQSHNKDHIRENISALDVEINDPDKELLKKVMFARTITQD